MLIYLLIINHPQKIKKAPILSRLGAFLIKTQNERLQYSVFLKPPTNQI